MTKWRKYSRDVWKMRKSSSPLWFGFITYVSYDELKACKLRESYLSEQEKIQDANIIFTLQMPIWNICLPRTKRSVSRYFF